MRRAALVLLVALLLVPAVAIAADGQSGPPSAPTSTDTALHADVAVLTLDPPNNAQIVNGSVDLGSSLTIARAGAETRIDRYDFETELDDGNVTGNVVNEAERTIEERSLAQFEAERSSWAQFSNGSIDGQELIRRIAETEARAFELRQWNDRVGEESGLSPLQRRDSILTALGGPVRSVVSTGISGNWTDPIFVSASENGLVLSTITDGQYLRETYRPGRTNDTSERINLAQASDLQSVLLERYGISGVSRLRTDELSTGRDTFYHYTYEFDGGSINAYLDGGTEQIFYEEQTRDLDRFSGGPSVSTAENGTRLVVNRSYAGGPLRVATYDNETGIPISTTVVVDGKPLDTGTDHVAWTLTPPTDRVNVTVIRPRGRVSMAITPLEPNGIDDP